jgi:hypothetical protein
MQNIKQLESVKPETAELTKYFKNYWGEEMTSRGLAILPQVLLEYRADLKLSYAELYFIEKLFILDFKGFRYIKDRDISTYNTRNITTIRKKLKEKGYLDYRVETDAKRNEGCIYSLAGLKAAIEKLVKNDTRMRETLPDFFDSDVYTPNMFDEFDKRQKLKADTNKKQKEQVEAIFNKDENKDKDKEESKEQKKEKDRAIFLNEYNKLHFEIFGQEIINNNRAIESLDKYLLPYFYSRKNTLLKALEQARDDFYKLHDSKRTILRLQDLVRMRLMKDEEEDELQFPSGLDVAEDIFNYAIAGGKWRERYDYWLEKQNVKYFAKQKREKEHKENLKDF